MSIRVCIICGKVFGWRDDDASDELTCAECVRRMASLDEIAVISQEAGDYD